MKTKNRWTQRFSIAAAILLVGGMLAEVRAANVDWDNGGIGNDWSNSTNWNAAANDNIPNDNTEVARYTFGGDVAINVDADFTINSFVDAFSGAGGTATTISGPGTLTIDVNNAANADGIRNLTGQNGNGSRLLFESGVTINNSQAGRTRLDFGNSASNEIVFGTASTLTLASELEVSDGLGKSVQFNGTLGSSSANLFIGSDNVSFGAGHDSSGFGRDIVFFNGAKLAIDGGTILNSGRKVQVNGDGELELNAENAINDANIVVGGANNLLIDVNSNQDDMGYLKLGTGTVTLDLDAGVAGLAFDDSSAQTWGAGALVISNFTVGVVSFGTDAGGLDATQLGKIQAYDSEGALVEGLSLSGAGIVIPEPATIGLIGLASACLLILRRFRI